jgi:sugar transferase (PEP-CTERM system associated)
MNAHYMGINEHTPFTKWFIAYVGLSLMAIHIVLIFVYLMTKEFSYSYLYSNMASYVAMIATPYIFVDLTYSLVRRKIHLAHIALKVLLSTGLSLVLLSAIGEIKPLSVEERHFALQALGVFACIMVVWDICRNISDVLPGSVTRVLLVGNDTLSEELRNLIDTAGPRYQLVGTMQHSHQDADSLNADMSGLFETAKRLRADKVVVSLTERRGALPLQEMLNCKLSGIEVMDAPSLYERLTNKLLIESITPSWFIFSHGFKITPVLRMAKRLMDVTGAVLGLTLCAPLAPFLILAIKLDSPGPVFFRQVRVGAGDREFTIFKLRTMRQDAENGTGAVWATTADPRITRLGSFLRKSRIDEIPQLINVLRGEMSLVGPRPERPEFVHELREAMSYYSERHFVKPGVTGWAQVCYPYGASVEDALEKLRYDMYYIKHISLFFDLKILIMTIGVVLLRKGAR